ncbi:unnamed protein product, partial [Iphiclides podalirius]
MRGKRSVSRPQSLEVRARRVRSHLIVAAHLTVPAHCALTMAAGGRTPKQRRFEMSSGMGAREANASRRRRGSCKCLFGAPDRDETRRLMAEQYARERKRFIRRFNFDVETECAYKAKLDSPAKFAEEKDSSRTAAEALSCVGNTDLRVLGSPSRRSGGSAASSPRTPRTPRTPRAARTPRTPRTPASRRQLQMTDYWTLRKHTESGSSDKEN